LRCLVLVDVVDELGEVVGGDLSGLVERREFALSGEAFALGFGEPLGDELGLRTRFDRRSVPLDLHVGRGDAPAGRLGSLVDARISGGTVEEVSECVLDVLGIEQLRQPAVYVADDLVLAQVGVAGMFRLEFIVAGVLGGVGEAAVAMDSQRLSNTCHATS
jgi:hypothetical protein